MNLIFSRSILILKNIIVSVLLICILIFGIMFLQKEVDRYKNATEAEEYRKIDELTIDMVVDMKSAAWQIEEYGSVESKFLKDTVVYVKDTLPQIDENLCYCEWKDGVSTEAHEYIIQISDGTYIGLRTEDWIAVESGETELLAKVEYMGDSQYEFFDYAYRLVVSQNPELGEQYDSFYELPDEMQNQFQEYVLVPVDTAANGVFPVLMQFVFVILIIGVVINCIVNIFNDDIKRWIEQKRVGDSEQKSLSSWESERNKERIEYFLNHTDDVNGVKCNNEFLYGKNKKNIVFVEKKDIHHIELRKYTYKIYFIIPIGVEWSIRVVLDEVNYRNIIVGGRKKTTETYKYIVHSLGCVEKSISHKRIMAVAVPK